MSQNRFVYYLITKENYWNKPTYNDLRATLIEMKNHALSNNVKAISMPRLGCGLDGLMWNQVKKMLKDEFKDTGIVITVYSL
jgi:O-acetyl-ADP-ribose deacetylase (regulator of RNase III)